MKIDMSATAVYERMQAHTVQVRADLASAKARYKDTSLTVRNLKCDLRDAEYRERKAHEAVIAERRANRIAG